jgi:hypothetical protein
MLTPNYTNTVSLDGIYILISILTGPIQNRVFGRETYRVLDLGLQKIKTS